MRYKRLLTALASIALLGGSASAWTHEGGHRPGIAQPLPPSAAASPYTVDSIDPVMRAILLAMAARMLREAAASPDPLSALGHSLEHTISAALASPETLRMLEALTSQALQDVPPDLRHALMAFAASMFAHARREMPHGRRSLP